MLSTPPTQNDSHPSSKSMTTTTTTTSLPRRRSEQQCSESTMNGRNKSIGLIITGVTILNVIIFYQSQKGNVGIVDYDRHNEKYKLSSGSTAKTKTFFFNNDNDDNDYSSSASWDEAIENAKRMLLLDEGDDKIASCLRPNVGGSLDLVQTRTRTRPPLPTPILNLGLPKCGSTTLFDFFECAGYKSTHWLENSNDYEGICMRDAVANNLPPLTTCAKDKEALLQMDVEFPLGTKGHKHGIKHNNPLRDECFFPQLSILDAIHEEVPDATFIMNFRPIPDWIKSVSDWRIGDTKDTGMLQRFQLCNLPNLPRGVPHDLNNAEEVSDIMTTFWCSHVLHMRKFVQQHPSHTLIELDLYDTNTSALIMSELFPMKRKSVNDKDTTRHCWGHSNVNKMKNRTNGSK